MIQNLSENEKMLINYIKNGQQVSINLLDLIDGLSNGGNECSDVLYETDGTSGLSGINSSTGIKDNWQFDFDFKPYKMVRCYFKQSDYELESKNLTPAVIVDINLDDKSTAKVVKSANIGNNKKPCDLYIGSICVPFVNDATTLYTVTVAIDSDKSKLQIVSQYAINGTTLNSRNNNGGYLYKIIGIK